MESNTNYLVFLAYNLDHVCSTSIPTSNMDGNVDIIMINLDHNMDGV